MSVLTVLTKTVFFYTNGVFNKRCFPQTVSFPPPGPLFPHHHRDLCFPTTTGTSLCLTGTSLCLTGTGFASPGLVLPHRDWFLPKMTGFFCQNDWIYTWI